MINAAVPMKQHLLVDCYVFLFFYCLKYYTIIYFCFAVKIEFLSGFILGNNFKIEFLCGLFPVLFWEITLRLGLFWTANLSSYSSCFSLWRQRQNFHFGKKKNQTCLPSWKSKIICDDFPQLTFALIVQPSDPHHLHLSDALWFLPPWHTDLQVPGA